MPQETGVLNKPGWCWSSYQNHDMSSAFTGVDLNPNHIGWLIKSVTLRMGIGIGTVDGNYYGNTGPLGMVLIINNIQSNTCTVDNTVNLYAYNGGTTTKENVTGLPTKDYTFTFDTPVELTRSIQASYFITSGYTNNYTSVYIGYNSVWSNYCSYSITDVALEPPTPDKTSFTITDLSGTAKSTTNGVKNDYRAVLTYTPNGEKPASITFTGNNHVTCVPDIANNNITITANSSNIDYGVTDNIKAICNGDSNISFNFNVGFYEKIKRQTGTQNLILNAKEVRSSNISITSIAYKTDPAKAHNAFKGVNQQDLGTFTIYSNTSIPLSQYFSVDDNTNNIFTISEDGINVPYLFRFYNSDVQEKTSSGSYKNDLIVNLTIYCAPSLESQISVKYYDIDGTEITKPVSKAVISNVMNFTIGSFNYTNEAQVGGYCRAFGYEIYNATNNELVKKSISEKATEDANGQANLNRTNIINSNIFEDDAIPFNTPLKIKIIPQFYFSNLPIVTYSKCALTLDFTFFRIDEKALLPKLLFPIVDDSGTSMLLTEVERFGYEFNAVAKDLYTMFSTSDTKFRFGVKVGTYELFLDKEPKYFSNNKVVDHMICDIGSFVRDKLQYKESLEIKPFFCITVDNSNTFIYGDEDSVVEGTLESELWYRPTATQGEYTKYYDRTNFSTFINKYRNLVGGELWPVPFALYQTINTDYWSGVAEKINTYVENMTTWLNESEVLNPVVCWIKTRFKHLKGEKITTDNLKQNYYDLLIQLSAYDYLTTHDYLNEHNYDHNRLADFTYNQITHKQGGI